MNRAVFASLTILCLLSISSITGFIQLVEADSGTVYIRADGSIDPPTAPISSVDNVTYTFTGNINYPAYNGIVVERSNIVIDGNGYTVQGNQSGNGLSLMDMNNVTIENAEVKSFSFGIYLFDSNNNIISGNNATANYEGIYLYSSSNNNTVIGNNATANGYSGIFLYSSSNNIVSGNNATANSWNGIRLNSSSSNIISGNNATANSNNGIDIDSSDYNNTVIGNNATANNGVGIDIDNSSNNTVIGNNATANGYCGIFLGSCSNIIVSGNDATANSYSGILFFYSSNIIVSGNNATANGDCGIFLFSSSNNNTVIGNNATANTHNGILLYSSSNNNTVSRNDATANSWNGILLNDSSYNIVSGNNATANGYCGIFLYSSSNNNTVIGNNATASGGDGIWLISSSDNRIYHNNFVNNKLQVNSSNSINVWDDGYPLGGNYWSDYNGTDSQSGSYQNETGNDGIGDQPCVIDANDADHFPLMGAFRDFNVAQGVDVQVVSNSTVSDFQFNGTAILLNVSGVNGTTGFCNVCVPTALLNGTLTVLVNGAQVQYSLLPSSNSTDSYLYFTYSHSTEQVIIMPELPSLLILPLFMIATLLAVIVYKKKGMKAR